jgi:hypothetical protein
MCNAFFIMLIVAMICTCSMPIMSPLCARRVNLTRLVNLTSI